MTSRVELGFDLSGSPDLDFFVLDDPVKGLLDNTQYLLGGVLFFDVTEKVLNYSISRGKSRFLDRYPAGTVSINLDNNERTFDPEFTASPYAGQIIPRREVRIYVDDIMQIEALINDWNLSYTPEGNSIASITASDALLNFANQALVSATFASQTSGEMITEVLNRDEVRWSVDKRNIDTGVETLQENTVEEGTNVLEYLQKITESESGAFFIGKDGFVNFRENAVNANLNNLPVFSDDGQNIDYRSINVVYGSELLYNEVIVNILGGASASRSDLQSEIQFGIINLTLDDLLLEDQTAAQGLADYLLTKFRNPEYRFESLAVDLNAITEQQKQTVLGLELNDLAQVSFTPNNIPPAISKTTQIIGISHSVTPSSHLMTLALSDFFISPWTLGDAILGRLSRDNRLGLGA